MEHDKCVNTTSWFNFKLIVNNDRIDYNLETDDEILLLVNLIRR